MLKIILACLAIVDGWIDGLHKKASTEVEAVVPGIKSGSADQVAFIMDKITRVWDYRATMTEWFMWPPPIMIVNGLQ